MLALKNIVILFISFITNIGVNGDNNDDDNETIKIMNAINLGSLLNQLFSIVVYSCNNSLQYAIFCMYVIPGILLAHYFNYRRKYLTAKFYVFLYYNFVIFFSSIYFSHPYLKYYYLPVLIAITISFNIKELKYLILCTIITFCFLVIEFTPLAIYIPKMYADKNPLSNDFLMLLVLVIHIMYLSIIYNFFSQSKARLLIASYRGINIATEKLKQQRNDMVSFAQASNKYLQSPIYVFNTFISKIEKGIIEQKSFEELLPYFELIQEAIRNEEMFINDMFDFNKLITSIPKYHEVFIQEFLLNLSLEFNFLNTKKMIFIIDSKNLRIHSDSKILKTIIFEIFKNAFLYNLNEPKLIIKTKEIKSNIILTFIDNGIGINEIYHDKVFESFVRINKMENINGSGLGLSKAKKGAEMINSILLLAHSSKSGSTFTLTIKQ